MRFAVRRPADAEVSPRCHRPSGGDVACSVHVGVARPCVADFALENRLALAVLGCDVPARGAPLRRVRGRDLLDPTVSLVLQACGEQTPTACADSPVQSTFLRNVHTRFCRSSSRATGHHAHVKRLNTDRIEPSRDVSGHFFRPVLASVSLTRFQLRNRQLRASSPARAAFGAGKPLLQQLQPLSLTEAQTRDTQQFTGRQGGRHDNTTIDTNHTAVTRTSNGIRNVCKTDMPAPSPIPCDPVGVNALRNRPREAKPYPTHLGHPHSTEPAVQTLDVMRLNPDLSESFAHTGFAPRRAAVRPLEKLAHGLGEIPQRLLLHGLRAGRQPVALGASRGQLSTLLVVAGRLTTWLPMLLLLDGQVPHIPGVPTVFRQHRGLLSGRTQPISRHAGKITTTTDKLPKGEATLPPPAESRGIYAANHR